MNTTLSNLTAKQLRHAADLKERIDTLQREIARILGSSAQASNGAGPQRKTTMSPEVRARIAAAAAVNSSPSASFPVSDVGPSRINGITSLPILAAIAITWLANGEQPLDNKMHNFAFFAKERELLPNHPFLKITRFEGAQITYS